MRRLSLRLLLLIALLVPAWMASATLEVSITVSGDIGEIQKLLAFIEQHNQEQASNDGNPLKINLHSVSANGAAVPKGPKPPRISTPQLNVEKMTPGQPALVTVAVYDEAKQVDTVAVQIIGTDMKADLYDDGSQGDANPADSVWTATLTPMEETPAGSYEIVVTGFDANGLPIEIATPDGESTPLEARTSVTIER